MKEHGISLDIGDQIEHLGAIPTRQMMYAEAAKAHVGLALFSMDFREPMVGASNKPFDYLACGLALLVPDTPEWNELFVKEGCARSCDTEDVESIAAALEWFSEHPKETRAMGERGRQLIRERWNYESQFEPILSLVHNVTNKSG
ncbi:MAG: glycosyltransferase [Planctomycetaceae bacterium]